MPIKSSLTDISEATKDTGGLKEVGKRDNQGSRPWSDFPVLSYPQGGSLELCFPSLFWVEPVFSPWRGSHYFSQGFKGAQEHLIFLCLANSRSPAFLLRNQESQKLKPEGLRFLSEKEPPQQMPAEPRKSSQEGAHGVLSFLGGKEGESHGYNALILQGAGSGSQHAAEDPFFQTCISASENHYAQPLCSLQRARFFLGGETAAAFHARERVGRSTGSQLKEAGLAQMPADREWEQEEGWEGARLLNRGLEMAGSCLQEEQS